MRKGLKIFYVRLRKGSRYLHNSEGAGSTLNYTKKKMFFNFLFSITYTIVQIKPERYMKQKNNDYYAFIPLFTFVLFQKLLASSKSRARCFKRKINFCKRNHQKVSLKGHLSQEFVSKNNSQNKSTNKGQMERNGRTK